jgi:hypothetical protein
MKQLKLVLFSIASLFFFTNTFSQSISPGLERLMSDMKRGEGPATRQKTYDEFGGSPYLNAGFVSGTITRDDGATYSSIPLRYNVYDDQIEFKQQDGMVLYIANPEQYKEIEIDGDKYIYLQLMDGKRKVQGYYELLEDGKIQLLKKHAVTMKDAEPAKPYVDPVPASFVSKPVAYFLLKEGEISEITNEKNLLETCGNSEKIQAFIKENKLKMRKEEDLKKIVNFSNSL